MALGKSRLRINARGRGILVKAYELTSGGAITTMSDLGYVESAELMDEPNMVESVDAAGDMAQIIEGSRKATLKVVLKQTTYDEINFVNGSTDKLYHVYLQVKLDNTTTTYQEVYIPLARITGNLTLSYANSTERKIELVFTALMPKGVVTVTPAGLSVPAGYYYTLADTATTALGQVTTANGTVYTAAV
jgi:hypothetical protein